MSLIGAALGGMGLDVVNQWATNLFNMNQADVVWERQLGASNTAYQRAMADMRAAGLNPILAYQRGGASTPSAQAAHAANVPTGSGELALSAKRLQDVEKARVDVEARRVGVEEKRVALEERELERGRLPKMEQERLESIERALEVGARRVLLGAQTKTEGLTAKKIEADLPYHQARAALFKELVPHIAKLAKWASREISTASAKPQEFLQEAEAELERMLGIEAVKDLQTKMTNAGTNLRQVIKDWLKFVFSSDAGWYPGQPHNTARGASGRW